MKIVKYVVVIEREGASYGAYVPDLPGYVAVGHSVEEVKRLVLEGLPLHLVEMWQAGEPFPHATRRVKKNPNIVETQEIVVDLECMLQELQKVR